MPSFGPSSLTVTRLFRPVLWTAHAAAPARRSAALGPLRRERLRAARVRECSRQTNHAGCNTMFAIGFLALRARLRGSDGSCRRSPSRSLPSNASSWDQLSRFLGAAAAATARCTAGRTALCMPTCAAGNLSTTPRTSATTKGSA